MDSTSATGILEAEHRIIEKVVAAMAALAETLEAGEEAQTETLQRSVPNRWKLPGIFGENGPFSTPNLPLDQFPGARSLVFPADR